MSNEAENAKQARTNGSILSRKELLELHERVIEKVRRMTAEEGFKALVASGI